MKDGIDQGFQVKRVRALVYYTALTFNIKQRKVQATTMLWMQGSDQLILCGSERTKLNSMEFITVVNSITVVAKSVGKKSYFKFLSLFTFDESKQLYQIFKCG